MNFLVQKYIVGRSLSSYQGLINLETKGCYMAQLQRTSASLNTALVMTKIYRIQYGQTRSNVTGD